MAVGPVAVPDTDPVAWPFSGSYWACSGPYATREDDLTVIVRGQPLWRTSATQIANAPDPAQAVLRAYRTHQASFLELLHGSFAVVVLDTHARTALLAVDRFGIERLTYCLRGPTLAFATSAQAVARAAGGEPRVRLQSLLDYLFFHMIPSPHTVFEGVRKIPPATAITFKDGVISEQIYWQPDFCGERATADSFATLKDSLDAALTAGVTATRLDRRSGVFLSGGLDSSTVTGYVGRVSSRPPRTFSIGFGISEYDELRYATIANARFQCEPHEYEVGPDDIVAHFAAIAAHYDEPFGNASVLPTLCCALLARRNDVDHLLAGDGGDELFAGNKRYAEQLVFERYQRAPRLLRRAALEPLLRRVPAALRAGPIRRACNYVAQANTPLPQRLESWNLLNRLGFDSVLHPDFAAAVDLGEPQAHMQAVYAASSGKSYINRLLQYDWRLTLADNDLRKVGTMCEAAGVRVSYPMLHPDVVDVSLQVPPGLKMRGMELRTFYKLAMADFLPAEIIGKVKHGFGLPFGLWLQSSPRLAELIKGNLAGLRARRIVQPGMIDWLLQPQAPDNASYYGVLAWTLAMLEQWFHEHDIAPA